jgi:hypothetical protein
MYGCHERADFATPAGDYAETYAHWLRGDTTNLTELAAAPSPKSLPSLAEGFFVR